MASINQQEEIEKMSKQIIRTGDVSEFFDRARSAARRADQGGKFEGTLTLSFEDPQKMFTVLSTARRRLMSEVIREPKTISELSTSLHRNRSAITKDVSLLESMGLVTSQRQVNPGHGIQKIIRSVAPRIEMVATLG
jgi:predicted transcriptional regulator